MELKSALEIAAALVAVVGALYGALVFVDKRIAAKIRDDSFVRELAGALRPAVIFDNAGSVLVDQGGMRYIEDIEVSADEAQPPYPGKITLRLRRHLAYAPLLVPLEGDVVSITSARGKKHDWVYTLDYLMTDDERKSLTYRVEIIL